MKQFLKSIGGFVFGVVFLVVIFTLVGLFLYGSAWLADKVLPVLNMIAAGLFFILLLIILPLSFFRKCRGWCAAAFVYWSYICGLSLWLFSLLVTLSLWGIVAAIIGLAIMGVGILPVALLASLFKGEWGTFFQLLFQLAMMFGCRLYGVYLGHKVEQDVVQLPMKEGEPHNDYPLVRRPSGAVEKVTPGAKRILSGVVADTLALANQTETLKPRGKLLIVDDELGWREVLREIFKDEYDLLLAEDGTTAIELAKEHDIDVTVTCLKMPHMDGLELLKRLKLLKPNIEVIVLTGLEDIEFIRCALRLRAFDYLNKPSDPETIRSAVRKAMQRRRRESEITAARKKSNSSTSFKRRGLLLIVDDEEGIRESLRVIFKDEYVLLVAENGRTAIELAQKHSIDVVVLDIYMAGMSGIDALERLKFVNPNIEVIMTTGMETTDTMLQALRLGACDYISTPFDIATIRTAVSKAMHLGHGDNPSREGLDESEAELLPVNTDAELEDWFQKGRSYSKSGNETEAFRWYRKAAEQGHVKAQGWVGISLLCGLGVAKDERDALNWIGKSVRQGNTHAACFVGEYYIENDYVEAYKWLSLAIEKGDQTAASGLKTLESWMSPQDLLEGKRRVHEFHSQDELSE